MARSLRLALAPRGTTTIDGVEFEGFFVEGFTLAELKTLRAELEEPLTSALKRNRLNRAGAPSSCRRSRSPACAS